jgi:1,4-dihydroxy-2-naphthoate octaprenyltransferase
MNKVQLFLQVTRARTLPVMAAPVIIGSVLAWQQGTPFHWGLFILALVGALAAHLGANVINDVFDFGAGADQAAQAITPQGNTIATGSQFLLNGKLSIKTYRGLAVACFVIALLCGIVLSIFRPWALVFGIIGFLLAFFYVAPPIRLAYIGRGLGEIDILVSFGILPLVGSFYVQAATVTNVALLASLPIGLYTMAVLYFHHFLHWRADKAVSKITPVVALGEKGARIVGAVILLLIAVLLSVDVFLRVFPWYAILAVFTIIPVEIALRQATGDLKHYFTLMASNLNANLLAALIILASLLVSGFTHSLLSN